MRDDFAAFILTHGRPERVYTVGTLERAGYTGKLFFILDDEDKTADAYRERFYSVMYCPSGVKIGELKDPAHPLNARIHHRINWNAVAPRILGEAHRKA